MYELKLPEFISVLSYSLIHTYAYFAVLNFNTACVRCCMGLPVGIWGQRSLEGDMLLWGPWRLQHIVSVKSAFETRDTFTNRHRSYTAAENSLIRDISVFSEFLRIVIWMTHSLALMLAGMLQAVCCKYSPCMIQFARDCCRDCRNAESLYFCGTQTPTLKNLDSDSGPKIRLQDCVT